MTHREVAAHLKLLGFEQGWRSGNDRVTSWYLSRTIEVICRYPWNSPPSYDIEVLIETQPYNDRVIGTSVVVKTVEDLYIEVAKAKEFRGKEAD